jgi:ribosomal protein L11 methyltransferase
MKYIEARVVFDAPDRELAAELISGLFYDLGVHGVVVEDPTIETTEDWADPPPSVYEKFAVVGYFEVDSDFQSRRRGLEEGLAKLESRSAVRTEVIYTETGDENWAESWKRFFKPMKVGSRLVIKPSWQEYVQGKDEIVIEIDPGMAFGTGTHPTTSLCLESIEHYLKPGDSFLDIGTGSGILMMAAAKLGASRMLGIDIDPTAIDVARENLRRNHIPEDSFTLRQGRLCRDICDRFRIVVSNILSEVILELIDELDPVLDPGGIFIFSGIAEEKASAVLEKMALSGFEPLETKKKEGWAAVCGKRKSEAKRRES